MLREDTVVLRITLNFFFIYLKLSIVEIISNPFHPFGAFTSFQGVIDKGSKYVSNKNEL